MQSSEILAQLRHYIAQEILDGRDGDLDEATPLLEWGVINSLEIIRLLSFIQTQFDVQIEPDQIVAEHFRDLRSIADLVLMTAADHKI